jgi:hypothetical protein
MGRPAVGERWRLLVLGDLIGNLADRHDELISVRRIGRNGGSEWRSASEKPVRVVCMTATCPSSGRLRKGEHGGGFAAESGTRISLVIVVMKGSTFFVTKIPWPGLVTTWPG